MADITIKPTKDDINSLPTTTGIYQFISNGELIYIGKSVNLKARLLSHLENARLDAKEAAIVNNADKIEIIVTDSEFKALLLESQLISRHKPKYNVRWRDDKSYLYIKVTFKEDYPKFYLTRRENYPDDLYFGPFPSVRTATNILREIRKVFPFCAQKRIGKQPCFYSKIGQCKPCPNYIESIKDPEQKKELKKQYRHNVRQSIKVLEGKTDLVLTALYKELKELTKNQQYEDAIQMRNRIYRLEGLIHGKRLEPEMITDYNKSDENIQKLKDILIRFFPQLEDLHRVECYDVSNLSQQEATASMVVFTDGLINKKEYRKFKIKDKKAQSDFEMMYEVLQRRFKNHWEKPNLIIVDGGKPQVRIALQALAELKVTIPLVGIAKHPDRLVIGDKNTQMIRPDYRNPGFNMVRALRDESHRFAKKYHILLREKKMML